MSRCDQRGGSAGLKLAGTAAELLAERALWLPARASLAVGDLHLGKAATLRAAGLAVPEGADADDLERLLILAERIAPQRLILLGDLVHAPAGWHPGLEDLLGHFGQRLASFGCEPVLVRGNHDRRPLPVTLGICEEMHLLLDGIEWIHDPAAASPDMDSVAAHLHPVACLGRRRGIREPCFWWRKAERTLVLPTFSRHLGGRHWGRSPGDRVWICPEGVSEPIELPE